MIKHLRTFEKTYNIKIPFFDHASYYLETLKKSPKYHDLDHKINLFTNYENTVDDINKL